MFYAFAIATLGLFGCTCTIGSSRDVTATPVDWVGAVLIGGAVAVFVFGVVEAPVRGWTHPVVGGCMTAGVALALVFVVAELRRRHPLLDVRLFMRPDFTTGAAGITFLFFANFGFFFVVMQYMQLILGYSPLQTAWALGPVAVPIIALGATMHLILPRLGLRLVVSVGLLLMAVGCSACGTSKPTPPISNSFGRSWSPAQASAYAVWAPGRDGRQLGFVRRLAPGRLLDDELGRAMPEHHDRGVGAAAGHGGKHRAVDDP